jgi:hypothetical protein
MFSFCVLPIRGAATFSKNQQEGGDTERHSLRWREELKRIIQELMLRQKILQLNREERTMRTIFFAAVIVTFLASSGYTQMGGGMMGEEKGEAGKGQMMQQQGMTQQTGMMDQNQMMGSMMNMTGSMSGMMGDLSGMMKNMTPERMEGMSGLMKDMSKQMTEMSVIMEKGTATEQEMKKLNESMQKMQKTMSGWGNKK